MANDLNYLAAWANKAESRLIHETNRATQKVALEMLKVLVNNTPVDTSQALSNWQVGLGQKVSGEIPPHFSGQAGSTRVASAAIAIAAGNSIIKTRKPRIHIHLTNNLDYIEDLDNGTISKQPGAFVAKAVAIGNLVASKTKINLDK